MNTHTLGHNGMTLSGVTDIWAEDGNIMAKGNGKIIALGERAIKRVLGNYGYLPGSEINTAYDKADGTKTRAVGTVESIRKTAAGERVLITMTARGYRSYRIDRITA